MDEKKILVLNANEKECLDLCTLIAQHHSSTIPISSMSDLKTYLIGGICTVVILDIDSIPISNRMVKELTIQNPETYFLCISSKRFHPELKDAISHHIYACLNKPIDPDELFFWLKSICEENDS